MIAESRTSRRAQSGADQINNDQDGANLHEEDHRFSSLCSPVLSLLLE
jgi:hypothetical protein